MKKLLLVFVFAMFSFPSFAQDNPDGIACAIYIDDKSIAKDEILNMGCKKGDPLLFYNYANKAKWDLMYALRVSALSSCDMTQPITDSGVIGAQPYQSIFCTFSGKFRDVKADPKYLKGWNWSG